MYTFKSGIAALALASLPLVAACSQADDTATEAGTRDEGTLTLGAALASSEETKTLGDAMAKSELSGLLDGPASYTVLAPTNAAFAALGANGEAIMAEDQRPVFVALLRDHMLPGHLTPETIVEAIDKKGGPVTMTTLGDGQVTFSKTGDVVTVTSADGATAKFTGPSVAANNGVVVTIDKVLLPGKAG